MTIDEFVAQMGKEIYIYRMAKGTHINPKQRKSAITRMKNSAERMQDIAEVYYKYGDTEPFLFPERL